LSAMDQQSEDALFPGIVNEQVPAGVGLELPPAPPRLRRADRAQVLLRPCALEDLLDGEHPARVIWELVGRWDLSEFLKAVQARGEKPGRAATDPWILISIWLYAYTKGVSNGRELARLCEDHDAYRWICGGVSLNYHTLNDFRVEHQKALDGLLTQMIAALLAQKLIDVSRISNDGTRVCAGAGRNSFKRREALEQNLRDAKAHVLILQRQSQDMTIPVRRRKAAERAAAERTQRIEKAIEELAKVEAAKQAQKEKPSKHMPARASTTDPEARVMHMPDGGKAPAYNIQIAVATESRAIVGVQATNAGSDAQQSQPIREQVQQRTGQQVHEQLMDGGFVGLDSIEQAAAAQVTVYAPVPKPRKEGTDPHQPKPGDSPAIIDWRRRMGTPQARELYKQRASTIETANAECKTYRGLQRLLVRGLDKVQCLALWSALAYNVVHFGRQLLA
jgi:transposase